MAANFFLFTTGIAALSLALPAHALGGPDDWDDFSNNFATDLAPILVLFGEQASKQFLSESTSFWDSVIFGIAPIGVITAVVSTIRLYGSSSLKAFIGRAQEAHGVAEAELCSSTSDDVCELWSNGGICRVFGRPLILEFFRIKGAGDFYPCFDGGVNIATPPTCGLYPPKIVLCAGKGGGGPHPKTDWEETEGAHTRIGKADTPREDGKLLDFAPRPNLSLNIGIKPLRRRLLRMIAASGALLQLSFFGYATWVTFYYPELYEEDGLPSLWSFCLATAGTSILVCGMICCAMLIESMSTERRFKDKVCLISLSKESGRVALLSAINLVSMHVLIPNVDLQLENNHVLAATRRSTRWRPALQRVCVLKRRRYVYYVLEGQPRGGITATRLTAPHTIQIAALGGYRELVLWVR